jgi:sec-independent protein translocase protein TatA
MGAMSMSHWLIVALVFAILFGSKKLGTLGQSLGEGIRGFRDALNEKDPPKSTKALDEESKNSTKST